MISQHWFESNILLTCGGGCLHFCSTPQPANELNSQVVHGISTLVVQIGTFSRWARIGTDKAEDQKDGLISDDYVMLLCILVPKRHAEQWG